MPLTIEGVVAMLACARIGAIHSVVYAGLGHTALRDRIVDAQAKIVIAGDVGFAAAKPSSSSPSSTKPWTRSTSWKKSSSTPAAPPKSRAPARSITPNC